MSRPETADPPEDPSPADQPAPQPDLDYVTRQELSRLLANSEARLDAGIARRFEAQSVAIGSLRELIGQTDRLLDRVLRNLELAREDAEDKRGAA